MPDDPPTRLTVATCQFPVSDIPSANAKHIRDMLRKAAKAGADIAHFSECALSGYAGASFESWSGYDWTALAKATEDIQAACKEFGIQTVVGSSHRLPEPHKPRNCVHVIDSDGEIVGRYDKRRCSAGDLKRYSPGDPARTLTFEANGVRCGVLICLEWSFPQLFRAYADAGCDLVFLSAHGAGYKGDVLHSAVIPPTMQGYAFTNCLFLSVSNASNPVQAFPSHWVRRSGRTGGRCRRSGRGITINAIFHEPKKDDFYAMVRRFRTDAEDGSYYAAYRADIMESVE